MIEINLLTNSIVVKNLLQTIEKKYNYDNEKIIK